MRRQATPTAPPTLSTVTGLYEYVPRQRARDPDVGKTPHLRFVARPFVGQTSRLTAPPTPPTRTDCNPLRTGKIPLTGGNPRTLKRNGSTNGRTTFRHRTMASQHYLQRSSLPIGCSQPCLQTYWQEHVWLSCTGLTWHVV